jgi:hypothetical protein
MIRALVIVIVAGFLTSLVCLSAAIAIGGPEITRGAWSWDWDDSPHHHFVWRNGEHHADGAQTARAFTWSGGDRLEVNAPADIEYVQAAGPPKLTISGTPAELDRVRVENGKITLESGFGRWDQLHISLSAPGVNRFELNGANTLRITSYDQDNLAIAVSGHGEIEAQGQAKSVDLSLSGAGDADLSQLKTASAAVDISGAGKASIAPTDSARLQISGVGEVNLLTKPAHLETHISGAGRIHLPGQDSVTAGSGDDDDDDAAKGPARPT